ncbi:cytochrome b5-like heme/steroid binding domain-containing protein [Geomesophilobacter sediminis]|uniref:Cytochrome b5 heme-binding domain-containing protein n=1 Tax=Geomesophilobacter sediminis TaxID=2798584 RepID=A0A8J7LY52_9BACT|nr:cytochrome b5 domain-containing protein [Geomesophilobacter sediminis]MBJ6724351.1 hypothetical protein [Geomesophilobacter sediminis]
MGENQELRIITAEELNRADGKDGAPEYIAIHGVVYDVGEVQLLRGGGHHGVTGGRDVSDLFVHNLNILKRLKVVGRLV